VWGGLKPTNRMASKLTLTYKMSRRLMWPQNGQRHHFKLGQRWVIASTGTKLITSQSTNRSMPLHSFLNQSSPIIFILLKSRPKKSMSTVLFSYSILDQSRCRGSVGNNVGQTLNQLSSTYCYRWCLYCSQEVFSS